MFLYGIMINTESYLCSQKIFFMLLFRRNTRILVEYHSIETILVRLWYRLCINKPFILVNRSWPDLTKWGGEFGKKGTSRENSLYPSTWGVCSLQQILQSIIWDIFFEHNKIVGIIPFRRVKYCIIYIKFGFIINIEIKVLIEMFVKSYFYINYIIFKFVIPSKT